MTYKLFVCLCISFVFIGECLGKMVLQMKNITYLKMMGG